MLQIKTYLRYLLIGSFLILLPLTPSKAQTNSSFAEKSKGRIYLQVQSKGEAWYVNPKDAKRYFLGRPTDAFNVMRTLGIGITNADLEKITKGDIKSGNNNPPSGDNSLTAIDNLGNDADSALNNTDSALSDLDNLDENEDTIPALVQ